MFDGWKTVAHFWFRNLSFWNWGVSFCPIVLRNLSRGYFCGFYFLIFAFSEFVHRIVAIHCYSPIIWDTLTLVLWYQFLKVRCSFFGGTKVLSYSIFLSVFSRIFEIHWRWFNSSINLKNNISIRKYSDFKIVFLCFILSFEWLSSGKIVYFYIFNLFWDTLDGFPSFLLTVLLYFIDYPDMKIVFVGFLAGFHHSFCYCHHICIPFWWFLHGFSAY